MLARALPLQGVSTAIAVQQCQLGRGCRSIGATVLRSWLPRAGGTVHRRSDAGKFFSPRIHTFFLKPAFSDVFVPPHSIGFISPRIHSFFPPPHPCIFSFPRILPFLYPFRIQSVFSLQRIHTIFPLPACGFLGDCCWCLIPRASTWPLTVGNRHIGRSDINCRGWIVPGSNFETVVSARVCLAQCTCGPLCFLHAVCDPCLADVRIRRNCSPSASGFQRDTLICWCRTRHISATPLPALPLSRAAHSDQFHQVLFTTSTFNLSLRRQNSLLFCCLCTQGPHVYGGFPCSSVFFGPSLCGFVVGRALFCHLGPSNNVHSVTLASCLPNLLVTMG